MTPRAQAHHFFIFLPLTILLKLTTAEQPAVADLASATQCLRLAFVSPRRAVKEGEVVLARAGLLMLMTSWVEMEMSW